MISSAHLVPGSSEISLDFEIVNIVGSEASPFTRVKNLSPTWPDFTTWNQRKSETTDLLEVPTDPNTLAHTREFWGYK